ncbi:MAG TPA: type II toxin-antitoxin system VapC family toxin [Spirochaetota bacterium]|nr:type II toxin-antitoxin system VapC family toxin [Spirochaetota bacterium]HPC40571.1 type II toxin-antitoxin system VapC family toxin [Spirochaetota bacterium]HPL18396.1 type II toxin-antitoxin system VapC family toxin [Spirochaetota bacterium]HQF07921.1 type II toxin-antitoxin system VapC family toxin [Spirochaetota bacterium]HQH96481.1 type II toxin-antitoxin system VapC family toxin [Spirochaetota bacterium]
MKYVIDCSFSSALFLPDEKSDHARNFFINLKQADQVLVPSLWWHETTNVLNVATKRKRLSFNDASTVMELLGKLPLETDIIYGAQYLKDVFEITQLYGLSSYDAAYIELALRTRSKLMSLDRGMISAIKNIGL